MAILATLVASSDVHVAFTGATYERMAATIAVLSTDVATAALRAGSFSSDMGSAGSGVALVAENDASAATDLGIAVMLPSASMLGRFATAVFLASVVSCSRSTATPHDAGADSREPPPIVVELKRLPASFQVPPHVARDEDLPRREIEHFKSGAYQLVGFVFRPNLAGVLPTIVYNHGSELNPTMESLGVVARWWQARGFVVFVPFRRGSNGPEGSSEGPYWKTVVDARPEAERDRATVEQLEAQNDDVLAALSFLSKAYYVDPRFVAVSGCSFGGIETVLTAERSTSIYAALDFAGASWTWSRSAPMRERLTAAVRASHVPIMFLQAENDYDTTPSKVLAATMQAAGKPATLKLYPPHGATTEDGHGGFCNRAMAFWGDDALAFLREAAFQSLPARPEGD